MPTNKVALKPQTSIIAPSTEYSEVPNKSGTFLILCWDLFPSYMALLGPTLVILGKSFRLHFFCVINIKTNPTYTPLLRPTHLLISEKTSHLHGY